MENKKRITMPTQLVCALPPIPCKVMQYLCCWSGQEFIKLYVHQMARALNLTDGEVSIAIETLLKVKLINVSKSDNMYIATINGEQVQKYFTIPFDKVIESSGIKMATAVTWNLEKTEQSSNNIEDMSEKDLQKLLLRIEASLQERQQIKKMVVNNDEINDLPF